ncbi:lupus La protein-like [Littorina saxatilis]|uniref:lupus La protein-like n=1 Tax=Littorina saxatilis TaxID=31220 RepID=UPI0038B44B1D
MAATNGDGLTDLEKKIIRQVEYYFGDMNLPRDKFLQEKIKEDDGWVTMETMLNFNRLKTLSDDKEAICNALKKSTSGLMEVSEDLTKIRRSPEKPLPDNTKERKEDLNARSVYVKGFPVDSTLDTLMEFFEKFGKVDTIFMRREKAEKTFKGSVFVTFTSVDDEKKFLEEENVKYQEAELIKMKKDDYFKMKGEEAKQKKKETAPADSKEDAEKKKEEDEQKLDEQMTKGSVLFLKGLTKETTMEDVRAFFGEFGNVAWVEYSKGDEKALLRFSEADAQASLDKAKATADGKVIINGAELESRVLEGEEEKEYWRKMFRDIAERKQRTKNRSFQTRKRRGGGRGGGGRGGGGRGGGRPFHKRGNRDDGDVPAKKAKMSNE